MFSLSPQTNPIAARRSSGKGTIRSPVPSAASWQVTIQRLFSGSGVGFIFSLPGDQMTEPIYDYDPADSLVDSEAMAVFLADAYDTGDAAFIAEAMAVVARAKIRIDVDDEAQKPSF